VDLDYNDMPSLLAHLESVFGIGSRQPGSSHTLVFHPRLPSYAVDFGTFHSERRQVILNDVNRYCMWARYVQRLAVETPV
jgi:hypothetical protein